MGEAFQPSRYADGRRPVERYNRWVGLIRSNDPKQVSIAVLEIQTRKNELKTSAGEERLLVEAKRVLKAIEFDGPVAE